MATNGSTVEGRKQDASTIKVTTRSERSTRMLLLHTLLKLFRSKLLKISEVYPAGSPELEVPNKTRKKCAIHEREVEGIHIYDITAAPPSRARVDPDKPETNSKRIYYFAGGGWQMPATGEHWALVTKLASQLPNTTISLISYPLAPNSPAPIAIPQLLHLYTTLLDASAQAHETVVLAGDSAGANLALCLPLEALRTDPSARCPAAILTICPSTDLRRSNPGIQQLRRHDPLLLFDFIKQTADAWRGDWDAADPRVSPLHADVAPLAARGVAVHGLTAGYDILSPDGRAFRARCANAGVRGEWLHWEKQMHCFLLTYHYGFPESKRATSWVIDVLRRC